MQRTINNQYNNKLEKEINKLFHSSNLPLHFNKTGNKEFTNYQRVAIIILFHRSKKSLRDFVKEFAETRWTSWLGLKKALRKSTLHDWLKVFKMKTIRKLSKVLLPKKIKLTAIDGTGFDSWQRSRHYEKRVGEVHCPHMPYAKVDLFIDVKTQIILDFNLITRRVHDVKIGEKIFRRNLIKNIVCLGDKGYDSENLHKIARENGIEFFAPVRKTNKKSFKQKKPKGFYRRKCLELPEFIGQRSIVETINSVLKRKQIPNLKNKKCFMKQREFAWHVVFYNLTRKIKVSEEKNKTFIFLNFVIYVFPDRAFN